MKTQRKGKAQTTGWDPWYDSYLKYRLDVEKKAAGTVRDQRCTLNRVNQWMQDHEVGKPLWQLSFHVYLSWLEAERQREELSPRTLSKCVSHLKGFLEYSFLAGRSECNVLDGFHLQDAYRSVEPRYLTEEEARRLVEACPSKNAEERRARMIVLLLYGCGVRTDELCQIRLQDVDHERQELFIHRAKKDRQRTVPIPSVVYTELLAYLQERGGRRGHLFRSQKGRRVRAHYICGVVGGAAARAALDSGVTPKVLRHSFATHLMDRGVNLAVISTLMGHRGPQETGVYLHAKQQNKEAAVEHLNGGASS